MTTIRVLLIEDNPGDAMLVQEYLRESAPEIAFERVDSLAAGMARLAMLDVEAVILDLTLPDAMGLPALVRLKDAFPTTPIIILTGLKDEATALRAMRQGAQDYLVKGHLDGPTIVRALRFAIERMRATRSAETGAQAASELRAHLDLVKAEHAALERLLAQRSSVPGSTPPAPAPGVTLQKRYTLRSLLGKGSYGQAFLALDEVLTRQIVAKVLHDTFLPESEGERQFMKEVRLLASLEHPHVIRVYDFGFHGAMPFYVMEYAEGGSLARLLGQKGALPVPRSLRLVDEILRGLEYVHAHGVLHRDIKPANILLNERQEAKIGDFGMALLDTPDDEGTSVSLDAAVAGTPAYAAPETRHAQPLTPASDIYGVGAIFFELLTGEPYMKAAKQGAATARATLERVLSDEPKADAIAALLRSMLERKPERRPQSAASVREALRSG